MVRHLDTNHEPERCLACQRSLDPEKFKSRMHSLAYGNAMLAAAQDYQKEMLADQQAQDSCHQEVDIDDLLDDPELERLHAERLHALQREAEKRAVLQRKGHGELQEIEEGQFIEVATEEERCVCHFFHADFERCRILDKHLTLLARKHFGTRFIRLSAPDAPFFTVKLQVKVLPCLLLFVKGVAVDRVVGFEELGGKDDFATPLLERRLLKCGVVLPPPRRCESDDDEEAQARNIRTGGEPEEDSDFD